MGEKIRNKDDYLSVKVIIILSIIIIFITFGSENFFEVLLKFAQMIFFVQTNMYNAKKGGNR